MSLYSEWDLEKRDEEDLSEELAEEEVSVDHSNSALENLEKKYEQQQSLISDLTLRHAAELSNLRTRHAQELETKRKFALETFLKELLPIVDSLEYAQKSVQQSLEQNSLKAIQEGVEATTNLLHGLLRAQHVEPIDAINVNFDPTRHHAMKMSHNPDFPNNHVTKIYQKGYQLRSRLLRPAIVEVNSEPAQDLQSTTASDL